MLKREKVQRVGRFGVGRHHGMLKANDTEASVRVAFPFQGQDPISYNKQIFTDDLCTMTVLYQIDRALDLRSNCMLDNITLLCKFGETK